MGHNPSTRDVRKTEKNAAAVLRTPEERLAAIRGSIAAKLFVTPDDVRFLLEGYDGQMQANQILNDDLVGYKSLTDSQLLVIQELQAQIEEFRTVYEQENRGSRVLVERILDGESKVQVIAELNAVKPTSEELLGMSVVVAEAVGLPGSDHEIDRFHDDGGAIHPEA